MSANAPSMSEADRLPGAEFLLRRLARATAVPAAERPPDVAAFVESMQLLREVCDLLPLTAEGRPALQTSSPASHQQVQLAFLKALRASYVCPKPPVCDRPHGRHLTAYCQQWLAPAPDFEQVLILAVAAPLMPDRARAIEMASRVAARLADPATQQEVSRHLERVAAAAGLEQPPVSTQQLRYSCCRAAVKAAVDVLDDLKLQQHSGHGSASEPAFSDAPTPPQLEVMQAAAKTCLAVMLELEPRNPVGHLAAAAQAAQREQNQQAADHALRAFQLAQQQRHDTFVVDSAQHALATACGAAVLASRGVEPASLRRGALQEALEAHQQAQQALRRCRKVLPHAWVTDLDQVTGLIQPVAIQAQEILRQRRQGHVEGVLSASTFGQQAAEGMATMHGRSTCAGCGQKAVGLRRCARCGKAKYCSTECQRQHWRVHRRECLPP